MSNLSVPQPGGERAPRTRGVSAMVRALMFLLRLLRLTAILRSLMILSMHLLCCLSTQFHAIFSILHFPRRKKHFKSATTGVATKTMRNELNRLVNTVSDPNTKKVRVPLCLQYRICPGSLHGTSRHSTPKCNHSSSSSLATSQKKHRATSCTHHLITTYLASDHMLIPSSMCIVTGTASSHLLQIRLSHMTSYQKPRTPSL